MALKKFLTEIEVIKMLNLPRTKHWRSYTLTLWIKMGLAYVKVGKQRYFTEEDIAEFFKTKYKNKTV